MQFRHFSTFVFKHFSQTRDWVRVFTRNFCASVAGRYVSRGLLGRHALSPSLRFVTKILYEIMLLGFLCTTKPSKLIQNVYARWFAIISQFIVTASLCTLWRLQMTRYSQVLVHSTVVNSRLSHQYMSISPFL